MSTTTRSTGGPGAHGHTHSTAVTDVTQFFDLLESNKPDIVQEVKDLILDNLNGTKESWFVSGLFEYYIQSGSARCCEILCGISREPHDKYLIERMTEGIRSPVRETRRQSLKLLGHAVCKQSSWLHKDKATHLSLFREVIKLLKTETDVVVILTGLLSMIMVLPICPSYVVGYIQDFFDVFGRLATWTNTTPTHNIPKEHVLHLQVGLYSLFHRLYAMFPCNFLSYLRHNFGSQDKRTVFRHTIKPMLEKVKMHPSLVTATRDAEIHPGRWESREHHDIIAECSKISLDTYESSLPEEIPAGFTSNLSPSQINDDRSLIYNYGVMEMNLADVIKVPSSGVLSQAMDVSEISSLVQYIDEFSNTAPPTPLSVTTTGPTYPHVGISAKTNMQAETAVEATPENTPIKDKDRSHLKLPASNNPAVMQLFGPTSREELGAKLYDRLGERPAPQTPPATPYSSVPSSPLPITSSMTRRDSIFDSANVRREPMMLQRLQKVQLEQQAAYAQQQQHQLETVTPSTQQQPGSQAGENARKVAVVAPQTQQGQGPVANAENVCQQETDRSSGAAGTTGGGPLTPVAGHPPTSSGPGFIDPDLSLITLAEESNALEDCSTTNCSSGGLHMADTQSMMEFAKQVKSRLRYHSHCLPGSDFNTSLGPSPGTSPSSTSSFGTINARNRYMKRSMSCPDIKKPTTIDEKEGSSKKPPKLPEVSEVPASGSEETKDPDGNAEEGKEKQVEPKEPEPEHPYEHLFQTILPGVLPLESRTLPSPHRLLDDCLATAASSSYQQGRTRNEEGQIRILKGQIELLHGQLLFERHRREAHALRNRRLAAKCKRVVTLEEQNNTMAQKIHNLEKEITSLKKEITIQRNMGLAKERELLNTVEGLEGKLEGYKKDIVELAKDKSNLESRYIRLSEEHAILEKESDQKKADYFNLENEVKNCQEYIERNRELKSAYEMRLNEILLLGELLRKYKEKAATPSEYLEDQLDCRLAYEDEVRNLQNSLENAMSQQEAANGTILDLKKGLAKREVIIEQERKDAQKREQEYMARIATESSKCETIKNTNQRLELEILSLQHQLSLKTVSARPTRGRITSASSPSNNGEVSPAGNSNHSDVDSAASAGGFQMSPERSVFIFGSPQFETNEMKDLQGVLDKEPTSSGGVANVLSSSGSNRRRNSSPLTHVGDSVYRPIS